LQAENAELRKNMEDLKIEMSNLKEAQPEPAAE